LSDSPTLTGEKMAISSKKMSAYILSGIVIAVVIISVVFISGVQFPHNGNTKAPITYGTLSVSITDAPVELAKLEVNIDSIEVQSQNSSWITLPFIDGVSDVTVDLLALQNISEDLSTTLMPTGNYTNIRLHVNSAVATYMDGSVENLNVPSDKINVIVHFEIKEATTTNVLLDMTAD